MNHRLGTMNGLDAICRLIESAVSHMESNGIFQWDAIYPDRSDFTTDIQNGTLYIVERDFAPVAVYVLNRESDEAYLQCAWINPDQTACILHRFCLDPKYQGKGLSRPILNGIEMQARALGYRSIRLDVFSKNPAALHLYRSSGYAERGCADWRKGRFLLMEKTL